MMLLLTLSASAYHVRVPTARVQHSRARARSPLLVEQQQTESTGFSLPFLSSNVPEDQQPVQELKDLRAQPFYDWPEDADGYKDKLIKLYQFTMVFLSLPIASTTFNVLPFELPQLLIAANIGTLAVMLPFVLRLRVGWGFVSARLKENSFYCELHPALPCAPEAVHDGAPASCCPTKLSTATLVRGGR